MSVEAFAELGVMPEIIKALEDLSWELPTDIQTEAIPLVLGGGDVMAAAETGSGKTGAFAIPVLQIVYETLRTLAAGSLDASKAAIWKLSDTDRDTTMAVDDTGLCCQSRSEERWAGCRATYGVVRGKYYYEAEVMDDGLCRVGWSTGLASRDLGTDSEGFGFGGTGKKSNSRRFDAYGRPYAKGDTLGCYIDCDNGTIEYSINGELLGKAFDIPTAFKGKTAFYPAVCVKNAEMKFNFGDAPFKFAPAPGYIPLIQAASINTSLAGTGTVAKGRKPLALILEPARELAEQTHDAINSFKKYMPAPTVETDLFTGGMETKAQVQSLLAGVDIITGTPGKIESLVESRQLGLENIRFFVLDEADRLLDTENYGLILRLYNRIPKVEGSSLQVLMFSATLHSVEIKELSEKICRFPTWVDLKGKDTFPTAVDHGFLICDPAQDKSWENPSVKVITDGVHALDKLNLSNLAVPEAYSEALKRLKPLMVKRIIDAYSMEQAMIFVRTKVDADHLEKYFKGLNQLEGSAMDRTYACVVLHAGRSQTERKRNLELFKTGEARFLICTDVAARGIDVKELPYVINYTLPDKASDYVHRVGRVGRADRTGLAISLIATQQEKVWFHKNCKGKDSGCRNTKLLDDGGCCMWYNEPEYLKAVEKIAGKTLGRVDPTTYRLPESEGSKYGVKRGEADQEAVFKIHAEFLRPIVEELAILENNSQRRYWNMMAKFNKM